MQRLFLAFCHREHSFNPTEPFSSTSQKFSNAFSNLKSSYPTKIDGVIKKTSHLMKKTPCSVYIIFEVLAKSPLKHFAKYRLVKFIPYKNWQKNLHDQLLPNVGMLQI